MAGEAGARAESYAKEGRAQRRSTLGALRGCRVSRWAACKPELGTKSTRPREGLLFPPVVARGARVCLILSCKPRLDFNRAHVQIHSLHLQLLLARQPLTNPRAPHLPVHRSLRIRFCRDELDHIYVQLREATLRSFFVYLEEMDQPAVTELERTRKGGPTCVSPCASLVRHDDRFNL